MMGSRLTVIATITVMLSWLGLTPAEAHVLAGQSHGVAAGLLHPFTGLDHLLAMLAIGIIASRLGGRAGRALPISCLLAMVTGASLGMQGVVIPYLEPAILVSVALLGLLVFGWLRPSNASVFLFVVLVGIWHGNAHAHDIVGADCGLGYIAGVTITSAGLQMIGLALGLAVGALKRA